MRIQRGRPRKGSTEVADSRLPDPEAIELLIEQLRESGERPATRSHEQFRTWLRESAEKELWLFSRWILGNEFLGRGTFHREVVCPFLTDFRNSRTKLLMLPMGHMKTTIVSRSMPLHALIQPAWQNIYFHGMAGSSTRILLANENDSKSKSNLAWIRTHLEQNPWLRWLWPHIVWENPKDAKRWSDTQLQVPRQAIWAEASVTAVGLKTGFVGGYYNMVLPDDIAALEASQSLAQMERAKRWLRTVKTRLINRPPGILDVVGTHWSSDDVYLAARKDPDFEVMIRSILEWPDGAPTDGVPLWPENPQFKGVPALQAIEILRKGTDAIEWALWYMNKPVPAGYTALRWEDLREYRMSEDGKELSYQETEFDERTTTRYKKIAQHMGFRLGLASDYDPKNGRARKGPPRGMDAAFFEYIREKYPDRVPQ